MRSQLQLLAFISLIGLVINFITTLEWDYYYNVINRDVFLIKATIILALAVYILYESYRPYK